MTHALTAARVTPHWRAGAAAMSVLGLTLVHHAYGAAIYATPWRLEIAYIALPAAITITAALWLGWRLQGSNAGRIAIWLAAVLIAIVPVALIGILEGGYNHVIKNAVYFAIGEGGVRSFFPSWLYGDGVVEMPDSLLFEATGIAQLPLAIWAAVLTWRLVRSDNP